MTPRSEQQKLANVLREAHYHKLPPMELADYLLRHGYSRTSATFDQAWDDARRLTLEARDR